MNIMSIMELQLSLAPPVTAYCKSSLDLNIYSNLNKSNYQEQQGKKMKTIDQSNYEYTDYKGYGSSLSTQNSGYDDCSSVDEHINEENSYHQKRKRQNFDHRALTHDGDDDDDASCQTLPLLINWNKQPNDEDDLPNQIPNIDSFSINSVQNGGDGESVVGWPPIKSHRRKLCHQNFNSFPARAAARAAPPRLVGGGEIVDAGVGVGSNYCAKLVKVQMEGFMITRKIDLSRHQSYDTFTSSIASMFGREIDGYTLTYLDQEGDWLVAGDVPWRRFVQSVKRLRLLRTDA